MSDCAIDRYLPGDDRREARDRAKTELAEVVRVWDELETELGYRAAMKAEADSDGVANQLAAALYSLRGTSDIDVLAKLHAVIEMENPAPWDLEHPWIRLQNILEDLVGMVKTPPAKADPWEIWQCIPGRPAIPMHPPLNHRPIDLHVKRSITLSIASR